MHEDWISHLVNSTNERPHHADLWCSLGQALHLSRRPIEALDAFERALRLNPNYAEAIVARCFTLGDAGRIVEGYGQLRPLFGTAPDDPTVVFAIGVYCMRHGFPDTGVSQLRRAAELAPRQPFVREFLAAALDQVGDPDGARAARARADELTARLGPVVAGSDASTIAAMRDFCRTWPAPGVARAHVHRARFLMQVGLLQAADDELRLANARFPGHPRVMVETGRLLLAVDRAAQASGWFEAAVAACDRTHEAHLELSYLDAEGDRMDAAVAHLRTAVELRPMYPDYRYQLGTLLLDLGRTDDAIAQLEQALILRPDGGHASLQLAAAYAEAGRHADALGVLESGSCRDWIESQLLSAEVLAQDGRSAEARSLLERLLAADPEQSEARELLAGLSG